MAAEENQKISPIHKATREQVMLKLDGRREGQGEKTKIKEGVVEVGRAEGQFS